MTVKRNNHLNNIKMNNIFIYFFQLERNPLIPPSLMEPLVALHVMKKLNLQNSLISLILIQVKKLILWRPMKLLLPVKSLPKKESQKLCLRRKRKLGPEMVQLPWLNKPEVPEIRQMTTMMMTIWLLRLRQKGQEQKIQIRFK